jgi:diadenosine tetraphosphate (Ap4A) HIT family hydrolase
MKSKTDNRYDSLAKAKSEGRAPWTEIVVETRDYTIFRDAYAVTEGHILIVPTVNTQLQIQECFKVATVIGTDSVNSESDITGFNVGLNVGKSAGQTCMYPHVHMIPRRDNDCNDPVGGVRNVIPGRGNYRTSDYYNEKRDDIEVQLKFDMFNENI